MAELARAVASLRLFGDDLDPDEITALLGAPPTESQRRGDELRGRRGTRIAKTGLWRLEAPPTEPADLARQVDGLLARLTDDLAAWQALGQRFDLDLFCGWFMARGNEGTNVPARTLKLLGERGIELSLDLYGGEAAD